MRSPFVISTAIILLGFTNGLAAADDAVGAKLYKRCAACHLPTGKGVPGAFPPLGENLASFYGDEEGRAYLALVLNKGLTGAIEVGGVTYRGFMPPQGGALTDEGTAAVLNYILSEFHPDGNARSFTAEEVGNIKAAHPSVKPRDLAKMRQALVSKEAGE